METNQGMEINKVMGLTHNMVINQYTKAQNLHTVYCIYELVQSQLVRLRNLVDLQIFAQTFFCARRQTYFLNTGYRVPIFWYRFFTLVTATSKTGTPYSQ